MNDGKLNKWKNWLIMLLWFNKFIKVYVFNNKFIYVGIIIIINKIFWNFEWVI